MRAPNWTADDDNPEGLIPIILFPDGGGGFGYGIRHGELDGRPLGYDRTINMTNREGQVLSPSFAIHMRSRFIDLFGTKTPGSAPAFLTPWSTTDGRAIAVTAFQWCDPLLLANNSLSVETDDTSELYVSSAFHDDGNGTQYLYAGTCSQASDGAATAINRRTRGGVWDENTGVNSGKYLVSASGALWATVSDYEIKKCPAGSNPFTALTFNTEIQVGTNEAKITGIGAIGPSPVVFKEDGIYVYIEADDRFENQYRVDLHRDNFHRVVPDGAGGIYSFTANGDIVNVQKFGSITTHRVLENKTPGRDTPKGRVVDIALHGADLYALMSPYRGFFSQPYTESTATGIKVLKTTDDFSSFTDYSVQAQDQSATTFSVIDLGSLDTLANGDAWLVGFNAPFLAFHATVVADNDNTMTTHPVVAISTDESVWQEVTVTDGMGRMNGPGTSHTPYDMDGIIALVPQDVSAWVPATYATLTKYWLRITHPAALDSSVTLGEVAILPKRTGPNFVTSNSDQVEDWEATSLCNKVLRGRRRGDTIIWDDLYTLHAVGSGGEQEGRPTPQNKLAVVGMPTRNAPASSLLIVTRDEINLLPLPPSGEPTLTPYPILARDALGYGPSPVFYPSQVDTEGSHELRFMEAQGQNLTREMDSQNVAFRWDDTNEWKVAEARSENYCVWEVQDDNHGRFLSTAYQLLDGAATDPVGPSCLMLTAWIKPYGSAQERVPLNPDYPSPPPARTTPEVS
jgi:hypothetical protein